MPKQFAKVLVAVSGAESDDRAMEIACSIAKQNKAKVDATYVIQVKRSLPLDAELEIDIRHGEEVLRHAEDIVDQEEWEVTTDLLQAREAGPAIVGEAIERGSDLVVMGVDYRRRFGEFDLGDTVSYVLKNAPCHVLLLRQSLPSE